jgi:hypothetical protein
MTTGADDDASTAVGRSSAAEPGAAGCSAPAEPSAVGAAPASASLGEVELIGAALARLAVQATDAGEWSGPDRHRVLAGLDRVVDGLTAVRATVLVAERDAGTWQGSGHPSLTAFRASTSRAGQRAAGAQLRQAEQLAAAPEAAAAVVEGRIAVEHATVIGRLATAGTAAQQQAATSPAGRRELLALAEQQDAGTFATTAARWAATADPAGLEADHEAQRAERFVHVCTTPRGTFVRGRLDSMAGHRLVLALEALSPRPAAEDDRDLAQRRADALDAMATKILASADTKPGAHVPPQITMILTEKTWVGARAERDRRRRAGLSGSTPRGGVDGAPEGAGAARDAGDVPDGVVVTGVDAASRPLPPDPTDGGCGYAPATLEDGTPVPASVLAAAMCDCEITRIVIDADGVPVNLGRAQRVFTGVQRRAVIARDRECAWPDCHGPARWAEIHHIAWWERDDGPTDVDNGVLLCAFHHHEVHRRDLSITRVPLPRHVGPPGSAPPGSAPPGSAPPGSATPGEIARVGYEFRDRAGRLVGQGADRFSARGAPGLVHERPAGLTGAPRPSPGFESPRGCAPQRPPGSAAERSPARAVDEPLEWITDPMTGARMPTIFLVP